MVHITALLAHEWHEWFSAFNGKAVDPSHSAVYWPHTCQSLRTCHIWLSGIHSCCFSRSVCLDKVPVWLSISYTAHTFPPHTLGLTFPWMFCSNFWSHPKNKISSNACNNKLSYPLISKLLAMNWAFVANVPIPFQSLVQATLPLAFWNPFSSQIMRSFMRAWLQ